MARALAALGAPALLDLLVHLGLASYSGAIEDPEPPLILLQREAAAAARRAGLAERDWPGQVAALNDAWAATGGPLRRCAASLGLGLADLFLAGLAAACEQRRAVALAVVALQAPHPGARPSVHLALDLLEVLFDAGAGDVLALADGPLVRCGLLDLVGEDALPQRALALCLPLWRVLTERTQGWGTGIGVQGTSPLAGSGAAPQPSFLTDITTGIILRGPPGSGRRALATVLAERLGRTAIEVPMQLLREDRAFATACDAARWLPVVRLPPEGGAVPAGAPQPFAVLAGTHGAVTGEGLIELHVAPPPPAERAQMWRAALGRHGDALDPALLGAAVLYPAAIGAIAHAACQRAEAQDRPLAAADVRAARQALAPEGIAHLAHPVARTVGSAALVTGPALAGELATLLARCRARETVWSGLGPSLAASATRGVRALFAGDTGTGKTMAAAYIATQLAAPLYRCDLAAVMNKYIGESEKNLGALLDHAEAADVVLLFDEADALFGRRSEGSETGERYANMLTNYLLTRLEAHGGIVILTANSKARIDPAFWRRLDQVVDFPAPGYEERLALWRSHLGARAPADAVLERLAAYCDLAGGSVRNAVLAAAVMTPAGLPIGLEALTPALQREYAKLRRSPPAALALAMRAAG